MLYGIASAVCGLSAAGFVILGLAGLFAPEPSTHVVFGGNPYHLNLRWMGGWALLAALHAWCGHRWFLGRAQKTDPDDFDSWTYLGTAVLTGAAVLVALFSPRIIH